MEDIDKRLKDMILDIKGRRASIRSEKSEVKEQERSLKELEDDFMSLALQKFVDIPASDSVKRIKMELRAAD